MKKKETILLTGGTGFLGSFVLKLLLKGEFKVIVLKRTNSDTYRINDFLKLEDLVLVDHNQCQEDKIFIDYQPEYIIHTATCYGRNGESDAEIIDANLNLPLRLLQAGKDNGLKGFLNTDTFFTEKMILEKGEQEYARTKKEFLREAKEEIKNSKLKFINLKLQQMYGLVDNPKKFIPMMIGRLKSNEDIPLTPGEQRRDFVYVEDVARAFVSVLDHFDELEMFEEFEIGTGQSYSIKYVLFFLKKELKSGSQLDWGALPYRENELMDSFANINNNQKINWQAKVDLSKGLRKTIEYYKK